MDPFKKNFIYEFIKPSARNAEITPTYTESLGDLYGVLNGNFGYSGVTGLQIPMFIRSLPSAELGVTIAWQHTAEVTLTKGSGVLIDTLGDTDIIPTPDIADNYLSIGGEYFMLKNDIANLDLRIV